MPRFTYARLSSEAQTKLDALFAAHGTGGAARRLRVSDNVVDRLVHGGTATAHQVGVVEAALASAGPPLNSVGNVRTERSRKKTPEVPKTELDSTS